MRTPNPFLREGLDAAFGRRAFRRIHLSLPAVLSVLLILVWPKGLLADFLRGGRSPQAFQTVAVAVLLLLSYLGGRSGLEEYAREVFAEAGDLAALRPVPLGTIIAGKFLFAALHTAFLLCLCLPFLAASLTVSGFGLPALSGACLLIYLPALAVRAGAVFLNLAFDPGPVGRNLALFTGAAALYLGTALLQPSLSPILLLAVPDRAVAPAALYASFFHLLLILCLVGASIPALAQRRRRAGG